MKNRIDDNYYKVLDLINKNMNQIEFAIEKEREEISKIAPVVEQFEQIEKRLANVVEIHNKVMDPIQTAYQNVQSTLMPIIKTIQLNEIGIMSREIAELVNSGKLERIKQGYYKLVDDNENDSDSEAKLISQLYPDGVICMVSALFYYGYSDRTPLTWDIAVDRNTSKARFNIDYPYVKPYYVDKNHLEYGITEGEYEDCVLKIFDRDRLICECIKHENKMDREIYNKAIRAYINDNKKNVTNLIDYSKRRNIHKKVRERIGVWL